MYQAYYHLDRDPFRLAPDHDFRFLHQRYAQVLAHAEQALRQGTGLVVLTGASGTGKTLLFNELLARHADAQVRCVRVAAASIDSEELPHAIAAALDDVGGNAVGEKPLHRLKEFLQHQALAGRRYILAIDEARDVSLDTVAQMVELAGLRAGDERPLVQILLAGPPGLAHRLGDIGVVCELAGMDEQETGMYVEHRLWGAGWQGDPSITVAAYQAIHELTQGVPRSINLICGRLLLDGSHEDRHELDVADVCKVAAALREEMLLAPEDSPSLEPSRPSLSVQPHEPVLTEDAGSSQVMHNLDTVRPAPARHTRSNDEARGAAPKTDSVARRSGARRRTIRYAAAGSLLTVTLLAALNEGDGDWFRQLSLAGRSGDLTEPAAGAASDRTSEPGPRGAGETVSRADGNIGLSPAPSRSAQEDPARVGSAEPALAAPAGRASKAEPGGTSIKRESGRPRRPRKAASRSDRVRRQTAGYHVTQVDDYRVAGRDCRQYTLEATIAGKRQRIYGTACRQPDGAWEKVRYPEDFYWPVEP